MILSPKHRQWAYIGTVVVMLAAIGFGFLSSDDISTTVDAAVKAIGAMAALLALFNVNKTDDTPVDVVMPDEDA